MKKLVLLLLVLFSITGSAFAEVGEEVKATVPETLFVNYTNNVLFSPDEPIIEIEGTYYLPISPQFLSTGGLMPIWNEDGSSVSLSGSSVGVRDVNMDRSDKYLVDYKRDISVIECEAIEVIVEGDSKDVVTSSTYRNRWSEVWYIPLSEELANQFDWEYYELGNYGDFLFLYDFDVADKELFMEHQRKINAMAKYMTIINKRLDIDRAAFYVQLVEKSSQKYDVEDMWIMAIMWQESWYDESCTYINAVGMMQMLKSTGKAMGVTPEQLLDPAINIDVCVNYLTRDRKYFDGDLEKAIHAYNQGSFRVVKNTHKTWYFEEVEEKYGKITTYIQKKVAGL